ncbi:hypothetical protein [Nocardiopsis alborubida]|uniref:Uncharacterized protein n=1 Tax=Nocardiopsis alborubida TaxID=146802 RepID=A0A7X6MIE1_9ACTN|nr:hypothetical protein [Nocardiopsis alborubida]NKZ00036.1 hypothetical protein [Nocardiopsis alborubida]
MSHELSSRTLLWSEVDPRVHAFDHASALAEIIALPPAADVPVGPTEVNARITWSREVAGPWTLEMTRALAGRFGRWSTGWHWSRDGGGGPVVSWCCPGHSIAAPEETLQRVADSLREWRTWLEELADLFDRHPLDETGREHAWERAAVLLTTRVLDRTHATEAWYAHCELVLTWYLTRWGVEWKTVQEQVEEVLEGRFESWIVPEEPVVREVAGLLADVLWDEDKA